MKFVEGWYLPDGEKHFAHYLNEAKKSKFPRDKICGDALSGKSVKFLDDLNLLEGLDKIDGAVIKRIIFGNPNHSECELHLNKSLNKNYFLT